MASAFQAEIMRVRASYRGLRRRKQALPTSDHKHNKRMTTGTAIRTTGIRCKGLHAALGTQRRGPSPIYPIGVSPDEGKLNVNRHKSGSRFFGKLAVSESLEVLGNHV